MGATASGGGGGGADPSPPRPSESAVRAFRGKTILVTGASRGLGRSLAIAASSCDPSLLILSGRDESALAGVRGECERAMTIAAAGGGGRRGATAAADDDGGGSGGEGRVEIVACDLADGASVEKLAEESLRLAASRRQGRSPGGGDGDGWSGRGGAGAVVDVLINNGGVSSRSSFLETRIDVDERVMRVNFLSGAALAKGLVPAMIGSGNGGRVIWISSVQGKRELFAGVLSLSFSRRKTPPRPPDSVRRLHPPSFVLSHRDTNASAPSRLFRRLCCSWDAVSNELRGVEIRRAGVLRISPVGTGVGRRVRARRQPGLRPHRSEPVGGNGGREVLQQDGRNHGERYVLRA